MTYLVMECHPSYAVVLDENGRFLRAANLRYEVGQTVTEIVEMRVPETDTTPARKSPPKWLYSIAAMAACMVLVFTSVFQSQTAPYGSVYMTINPEVRIDILQDETVIGLTGMNTDGEDLIEGYVYKEKHLDLVTDDLVDRAIDMGYLSAGGQITLTLDGDDNEWIVSTGDALTAHLGEHLNQKLSVTVAIDNPHTGNVAVTIPEDDASDYGMTDYGVSIPIASDDDTDYGPNNDGITNFDDTDYGPNNDGITNFDDTDYGPNNDGVTDYDDTDYGEGSDGVTDYTDTDYGTGSDGVTDYFTPNDTGNEQSNYVTSIPPAGNDSNSNYGGSSDDGSSNYDDNSDDDDD